MIDTDVKKIYNVITQLQSTSSRNDKISILKNNKNNEDLKFWLDAVYNPYKVFGIQSKKLSKIMKSVINSNKLIMPIDNFESVIKYLSIHNTGRDEDVMRVVGYLMTIPNPKLKEFTAQSITKSVKIGMTGKTINKALNENLIPEFSVQLAKKWQDANISEDEEIYITQKLDGCRLLIFNYEDKTLCFTRQGQPVFGLNDIVAEARNLPTNMVYDGECVLDNKNNLSSADLYRSTVKEFRKDGDKHNLIFNCFDLISIPEFEKGESSVGYFVRRQSLDNIFNLFDGLHWIKKVPLLYYGRDHSQVNYWLNKMNEKKLEGVMVNREAPYQTKRTSFLLKVKKMQTIDLRVTDIVPGEGKYKGMLGAVGLMYKNNRLECGSGFTDLQRKQLFSEPSKIVGKIIELQYFEETHNSKNGAASLRFPVFLQVREDKNEESYY